MAAAGLRSPPVSCYEGAVIGAAPAAKICPIGDLPPLNTVRLCYRIAMDAFYRFNADDGWAIASHIALSVLMSMFPFLILVTAIAGFIGSKGLADEVAQLIIAAWPHEVSGGIAGEIHSVLTTARGGILTVGALFAIYFSSSGVESLRIGLNRAYGLIDKRPWWLLRMESIGYVIVSALGLLALAFLVVLGPLVFRAALAYAPWLAPLERHYDVGRFSVAAFVLTVALMILHMCLAGHRRDARAVARLRLHFRPLFVRLLLCLCALLRGPRFGDDRSGISLFHRVDLHLWRRAQCRDRARIPAAAFKGSGADDCRGTAARRCAVAQT